MDVSNSLQVPVSELLSEHFDVLIFTYYPHDRWNRIYSMFRHKAAIKIRLVFDDGKSIPGDYAIFPAMDDVETFTFKADDSIGISEFFSNLVERFHKPELKFLVDYTSMSKPWFSAMVQTAFSLENERASRLVIFFATLPPTYFEPGDLKETSSQGPLMFSGFKSFHKKLALLVGLGYEHKIAQKMVDALKPETLCLFYADPPFHPGFLENVKKLNSKLLAHARPDHIFPYPASDIDKIDHILSAQVLRLRLTHRIRIIPLGPRVFTLSSLLVQARYPDVEVWNTGYEAWNSAREIGVSGDPLVYKMEFCED